MPADAICVTRFMQRNLGGNFRAVKGVQKKTANPFGSAALVIEMTCSQEKP